MMGNAQKNIRWGMAAILAGALLAVAGCTVSGISYIVEEPEQPNEIGPVKEFKLLPRGAEEGAAPLISRPDAKYGMHLIIPFEWDITNLLGEFVFETGVRVEPDPSTVFDYTDPVIYTVYDKDEVPQEYKVVVSRFAASDKEIRSFKFPSLTHNAAQIRLVDDGAAGRITVALPYGTDARNLSAEVEIVGHLIDPDPATPRDYTSATPIVFTVHAQDGSTRAYTVEAMVASSSEAKITAFKLPGMTGTESIDQTLRVITVNMPNGSNISSLAPEVTVSDGASYTPAGAQNFNSTVMYTVKAASGVQTIYSVKVNVSASSAKQITGFLIDGGSEAINRLIKTTINESLAKIDVEMPSGMSLANLKPTVTFIGDSVSPASGAVTTFTSGTPKTYTVKAADGTTKPYSVTLTTKTAAPVALSSVTVNGAEWNTTTTLLTLEFSADVPTLAAGNITLSNYTKGAFSSIGSGRYTLGISGSWTEGAKVNVTVSNPVGYAVTGSPKNDIVLHRAPQTVIYQSLTPDGANFATATTYLDLSFDMDVAGLAASDILFEAVDPNQSAVKGTFTKTGTGKYRLNVSNVSKNGMEVSVKPVKQGYIFSPREKIAPLYRKLTFDTLTADGKKNESTTTKMTIKLSEDVPGFSAADITLTPAITKGTLVAKGNGSYELPVSGFTQNTTATVALAKSGVTFAPASKPVEIFYFFKIKVTGPATGEITVPTDGVYRIEVVGAAGERGGGASSAYAGYGGKSIGDITLNAGDELSYIAGGVGGGGGSNVGNNAGVSPQYTSAGKGGDKSEFRRKAGTILLVAGGGGGGGNGSKQAVSPGTVSSGGNGGNGGGANAAASSGATSAGPFTGRGEGAGGGGGASVSSHGGGGARGHTYFFQDYWGNAGGNGTDSGGGTGAGYNNNSAAGAAGGGGGNGYKSGGGGGSGAAAGGGGGGGGSGYAASSLTNVSGQAGVQSGNGYIQITRLDN